MMITVEQTMLCYSSHVKVQEDDEEMMTIKWRRRTEDEGSGKMRGIMRKTGRRRRR